MDPPAKSVPRKNKPSSIPEMTIIIIPKKIPRANVGGSCLKYHFATKNNMIRLNTHMAIYVVIVSSCVTSAPKRLAIPKKINDAIYMIIAEAMDRLKRIYFIKKSLQV